MEKFSNLLQKLNDLKLKKTVPDRKRANKIIRRFCKVNNISIEWVWNKDKFIIDNKYYLYQNDSRWFELKAI